MKQVLTWLQIGRQFRKVAKDYPTLSAQWREVDRVWVLRPDLRRPAAGNFNDASTLFKSSATVAVTRLRKKSRHREPWQLWLDLLREYLESHGLGDRRTTLDIDPASAARDNFGEPGRYSDCGSAIYVSGREYALMHESGKSLRVVRRELGYSTFDEFLPSHGFHLIHPDGRLALDGIIACVPQTSADFARHLQSAESSSNAIKRQKFLKPHISPTPRKPTLNAFAERIGIEQSSLSRWYRGLSRLSATNLELLANYLKVENIPN